MSIQKKWHERSLLDVLKNTDVQAGLTQEGVEKSRIEHGENKLDEGKKKSFIRLFIEQFSDVMIMILIAAAIISAFLGEGTDAAIIMAIVILNAILGILQENKAEKALSALKEMSAPDGEGASKWIRSRGSLQRRCCWRHLDLGSRRSSRCGCETGQNLQLSDPGIVLNRRISPGR